MPLELLKSIHTESDFTENCDRIRKLVQDNNEIIQKYKDAMGRILVTHEKTWKEKISLIANRIIDPSQGKGGFEVLVYTDDMKSIISILQHIIPSGGLDFSDEECEFINFFPRRIDSAIISLSKKCEPVVCVSGQSFTPRELVASALFICIAIKMREDKPIGSFWRFIRDLDWSKVAVEKWFNGLHSYLENRNINDLLCIGGSKLLEVQQIKTSGALSRADLETCQQPDWSWIDDLMSRVRKPAPIAIPESPRVEIVRNARDLSISQPQPSMTLDQYSELLCKVLTGMSAEMPATCWSLVELDLDEEETKAFENLPGSLDQMIRQSVAEPNKAYQMNGWGVFTSAEVVGSCLMICETIALRDRSNANQYTQTLLGLNWSPCTKSKLFVQRSGFTENEGPNHYHNNLIRAGVSRLRLRSAIDAGGNNRWEKTLLLQIGLSKDQWSSLLNNALPMIPAVPVIAQDLYTDRTNYHALSFKNTWDALRSFKANSIERRDTENSLYDSPWIANEWIDDLLNVAGGVPITNVVSIIQNAPKLRWNNNVPCFVIRLDQQGLRNRVPHEINEVDLMLNGKWKARLAYINNSWNRVTGGIDNNLEFRYDLDTQTSADIEVSVISAANPTNTLTPQTIHLWQCESLISRFGNDGLLHRNAWRKQVVMGEGITLIVPSGSTITPEPIARIPIDDGMSDICHIAPNWQGPVKVTQDKETWWDSDNLVVPDRSLNLDDKTFEISLLVDSGPNANGEILGHLEWIPTKHPISWIQIGKVKLDPDSARKANAIHIKCDWFQSKPVIVCKVNSGARSGRVEKKKYPSIRAYNSGILICHTESDGLIMDPRKIETAEQLRKTKFQYLKPETRPPLPPLPLFQFGTQIVAINNNVTRLNQVPFFARGLGFQDGSGREQIPGVVERGIISRVARISTKIGETSLVICLNRGISPIHPPGHDGRHHRIVVFSRNGEEPGNRFKWTVIEGADNITQEGEANPEWTVKIAEDLGLILGVAVTFGPSFLGYWVKEGQVDSFSQALEAANLTPDEATDLARMLRWFQAPLLDPRHKNQIAAFFALYAVPVMNAWLLESRIFLGGNQYQNDQAELCWHWVVSEIAQDAKRRNNELNFNGLYNINQCNPALLLEQVRDIAFAWPPAAADFARAVMAQNPKFRWNYAEVFEVQQCIIIEPMDIGALRQRINWGIQLVANPYNLPDFNRDEQFKPDEVRNGLRRQSYCKLIAFKLLQPEAEL